MAAEHASTTVRAIRVKKTALRAVVVTLIVINVLVILPGAVFSIILGDYIPTLIAIGMSMLVWAAGYGVLWAVRAHRAHRTSA